MSNIPDLQPPAVSPRPYRAQTVLKDVAWGLALSLALAIVIWWHAPQDSLSIASSSGDPQPPLAETTQPGTAVNSGTNVEPGSPSSRPTLSSQSMNSPESTSGILAENASPVADEAETQPMETASAAEKAVLTDSLVATHNNTDQADTARKPEEVLQVKRVRDDLLKMRAPSLSAVRAERPAVKAEQKVEFFSVKSEAQTVAFVVDCSSSMSGAPFDRCRLELIRAIINLRPDQAFYVIFFNDGPVPLSGDNTANPTWSTAQSWIKHQTGVRLASAYSDGGTNPEPSIRIAASINPDVIYLLSDGGFSFSNSTILELRHRGIKVNTIAFMDPAGSRLLQEIAAGTNGVYNFVPDQAEPGLAQELQAQMAGLLIADAAQANPGNLALIHGALVDFARRDYGPLRSTDITRALAPWRNWFRTIVGQQFATLSNDELAKRFAQGTVDERIAVLLIAKQTRNETLLPECILGIRDVDPDLRQAAREALETLSGGIEWSLPTDTGDPAEIAAEAAAWERWVRVRDQVAELQRGGAAALKSAATDPSADRRWAAAMAMGGERNQQPELLLVPLVDADPLIRAAAARSLQAVFRRAKHDELGPELGGQPGHYLMDELLGLLDNSDPMIAACAEQVLTSLASPRESFETAITGANPKVPVSDWSAWWIERKDRAARSELENAKKIMKNDAAAAAAAKRLNAIIVHYPGTPSAEKARRLLAKP